jgi:O-antigen/teichoic acid export membrane protein
MLRFSILWATLTWLLGAPLILRLGVVGYGIANLAVPATSIFLYRKLGRLYPFHAWRNIAVPGLALTVAVGVGGALEYVSRPATIPALVALGGVTVGTYLAVVWLCWRQRLLDDVYIVRKALTS